VTGQQGLRCTVYGAGSTARLKPRTVNPSSVLDIGLSFLNSAVNIQAIGPISATARNIVLPYG